MDFWYPDHAHCRLHVFLEKSDQFDWRWGLWFAVGTMLLFAEVFDVIWLKEATCNMIVGTHHNVSTGPCYKPQQFGIPLSVPLQSANPLSAAIRIHLIPIA